MYEFGLNWVWIGVLDVYKGVSDAVDGGDSINKAVALDTNKAVARRAGSTNSPELDNKSLKNSFYK